MKASNNVALVPANGTFELANTLFMAYRCVHSTIPTGRQLIIHPLPTDLCPMMISDSHWLLENVLCLTSNAIKYSDSGDIDLVVTIEPTPAITTFNRADHRVVSAQSLSPILTPRSVLETGVINRRQLSISNRLVDQLSARLLQVMYRPLTWLLMTLSNTIYHNLACTVYNVLVSHTLFGLHLIHTILIHSLSYPLGNLFTKSCTIGTVHYRDD